MYTYGKVGVFEDVVELGSGHGPKTVTYSNKAIATSRPLGRSKRLGVRVHAFNRRLHVRQLYVDGSFGGRL